MWILSVPGGEAFVLDLGTHLRMEYEQGQRAILQWKNLANAVP